VAEEAVADEELGRALGPELVQALQQLQDDLGLVGVAGHERGDDAAAGRGAAQRHELVPEVAPVEVAVGAVDAVAHGVAAFADDDGAVLLVARAALVDRGLHE
jgi:hypothetical protein